MKQTSQRNALIARIHVLKKELNLSDEEYRTILYSIGSKESCAALDDEYLNLVRQCMESMMQKLYLGSSLTLNHAAEQKKIAKLGLLLGWNWHDIAHFCFKEVKKNSTQSCDVIELNKIINGMSAIIEGKLKDGSLTLPQNELEKFLQSLKRSNKSKEVL
jgi:phage gp16-like protein